VTSEEPVHAGLLLVFAGMVNLINALKHALDDPLCFLPLPLPLEAGCEELNDS